MTRATLFSLSSVGDLTYSSEALEASQVYVSNSQEVDEYLAPRKVLLLIYALQTAEFTVRAFAGEKYTQVGANHGGI